MAYALLRQNGATTVYLDENRLSEVKVGRE
jgi:hypothetical protein